MSQQNQNKITTTKDPYKEINKMDPGTYTFINPETKKVKILTKCGKSNVEQSHRTEIKKMVADAESRGLLRASMKFEGTLDDFPDYDFQEAQFMMADAKSKFEQLPSQLREKMDNNPAKFMDYVNKATPEELQEIGLKTTVHDGLRKDGSPVITPEPTPAPEPTPGPGEPGQ